MAFRFITGDGDLTTASEPPTIGHVVAEYLGRSETFIHTTLRHQRAFRPVVLAESTTNLAEFPFDPVVELEVPRARRPWRRRRAVANALVAAAEDHGCVALHAHFGNIGFRSLEASRRLGVPLVTTFYGWDLSFPGRFPEWHERYAELFEEGAIFLCEGPAMAERLTALGCPAEKIRVVEIGLDLTRFPFSPPVRRRPLVILQTARFVEKKGLDLSIRAFAAAQRQLGESELWLVGDGELRPELERLAGTLGVEHAVRFHGMLSHLEYAAALRDAHIAIQPSRTTASGDTEGGAPTVLLEMQATGTPVVATRHADIPHVVATPDELVAEDDVDGLAAALVRVAGLADKDWLARAVRGRRHVERRHEANLIARRIESAYREALGAVAAPDAELATT